MSTNQSLSRGLAMLDAIDGNGGSMGIRELARALDISPSIAQRLANTLVEAGYLQQIVETRRYRLGYRALAIGSSMVRSDALYMNAAAELKLLADHRQLNGYLGVIQQNNVVYLHTVQSSGAIAIRAEAGSRVLAHSTAMGKALIAELPVDEAQAVLGPAPYAARTARTITDIDALNRELEAIRKRGYAISDEENELGIVSIGAVIRNSQAVSIAAISVAFLTSQHSKKDWAAIANLVVSAAAKCSGALGYSPNSKPQPVPLRSASLGAIPVKHH
jgi:DNA-binding IclR family transcriptional regulator